MQPIVRIPAAEYMRMSTEDQQYSVANQQDAIRNYAENHGYVVVSTYIDAGKSGVSIRSRAGLRKLLNDVVTGSAPFKTILVFDVSRWGRFPDADEAAHYEFLCKSAGIPVCYCAEQFENDGTIPSSIMKALKRSMAAEYSRELGNKVLAGQRRLALLGFRVCGTAGFGLRRMMICPGGKRNWVLQDTERKAIKSYHNILVPGPRNETETIRTIFSLAVSKANTPREIARQLNRKKMKFAGGRPWDGQSVFRILKNEKYTGSNIFGKTTRRLSSSCHHLPRQLWMIRPQAFMPIIEQEQFDRVQRVIRSRKTHPKKPDRYLLDGMKKVLARHGKLTEKLLKGRGIFDHRTYQKRFGSVLRAYELIGYRPSQHAFRSVNNLLKMKQLRSDLLRELKALFPENLRIVHLPGQKMRQVLEFDKQIRLSIQLCPAIRRTVAGEPRWLLRAQPLEQGYPCLVCMVDSSRSTLVSYYVVPEFGNIIRKYKVLKESHKWLAAGKKLKDLSELYQTAKAIAGEWQEKDDTTIVGDTLITARTSTITIAGKDIMFPSVNAEILKILIRNVGEVVPRTRLLHPFSAKAFPSAHLNAHMSELRKKLGVAFSKRIETVIGEGYRYVTPVVHPPRFNVLPEKSRHLRQ